MQDETKANHVSIKEGVWATQPHTLELDTLALALEHGGVGGDAIGSHGLHIGNPSRSHAVIAGQSSACTPEQEDMKIDSGIHFP